MGEATPNAYPMQVLTYVFTYKHQMDPGSVNLKFYSDTLPHSSFEELSPE